ncbi:MAG: flavin reductase family protein [Verrucomicrobiota bacterium]
MNSKSIGAAIGKISSGLYVATAQLEGVPTGMLCSFVEQAGFEPPMISIALGPGRPIVAALEGSGLFGIHVLSKDDNALLKAFARGDNPDAFTTLARVENRFGIPQFAEAWAFLACKVSGKLDAGDHTLYLAEVLDGALQRENAEPMIRVRANGFSY